MAFHSTQLRYVNANLNQRITKTEFIVIHQNTLLFRYVEKTDAKLMRKKVESVGLRIPSPTVREKTFVLKTRRESKRKSVFISAIDLSQKFWKVLVWV